MAQHTANHNRCCAYHSYFLAPLQVAVDTSTLWRSCIFRQRQFWSQILHHIALNNLLGYQFLQNLVAVRMIFDTLIDMVVKYIHMVSNGIGI